MVKIYCNKRNNKDIIKNKSNQKKINLKKPTIKPSKLRRIPLRKTFKRIIIKNKLPCKSNKSNNSNIYNNSINYQNLYNNILKEDIFYVMRCYDCSYIPLLKIKYNQVNLIQNEEIFSKNIDKYSMVQLLCPKGHNITATMKQYLINCKINHNFLSLCGQCHESKSNELFNFSYCKICKKTLCKNCSVNHSHNNKSKNVNIENIQKENENSQISIINEKKSKNLILINELDFYCQIHKKEFYLFCKDCNSNLCKECEINHSKMHKIIELNDIKLTEEEIKNIEFNIDLGKKRIILFDFKILSFIQTLKKLEKIYHQLLNLYNFFIDIYKDQIIFAEDLLSIYKDASLINKFNYQVIQNVRNLKFNIRGIPIKNSNDFTTNIKSLTSYLTNNKNFLLLDIKNYYSPKKIIKARIRAAAKRIRCKIHLNNLKRNNNSDNKEKNNLIKIEDKKHNIEGEIKTDIEEKINNNEKNKILNNNKEINKGEKININNN